MVVPPAQSKEIYDAIIANGGIAEYKVYPDEGHGFREEANMRDALEREILFYVKCLEIGL
jgi:dipeptidyl aminopeptidase/acylaminoacyl peptidase